MNLFDRERGVGETRRWKKLATFAVAPLVVATLLIGCGDSENRSSSDSAASSPSTSSSANESDARVATIPGAEHVHGLGINPANGELLIATHNGLWRVSPGSAEAEQAGDSSDDYMGFTVIGPDSFLSSGHPGPGSDLPPLLGLQRSDDAGSTWQPVSLLGEADLHVLKASAKRVYGVDSVTGAFLASVDSGESWESRNVPGQVADLAVAPDDPARLVASTGQGMYGSENGGTTWTPLADNRIGLLTWPSPKSLLMVDGSGRVSVSANGGRHFSEVGDIGSTPEAFGSGDGRILAAADGGRVLASEDAGRTWTTVVEPKS